MISKLNLSDELCRPGYVSQKLHLELYTVILAAVMKRDSRFNITYINVEVGEYLNYINHNDMTVYAKEA
jgi:hypothetical protein